MTEMTLFGQDPEERPGRAPSSDPHTSHLAARRAAYRAGSQKALLLAAYHRLPDATDEEAAKEAGVSLRSSFWKRCGEMREDGLIAFVTVHGQPLTRVGDLGAERMVSRITPAGIEMVRRLQAGAA